LIVRVQNVTEKPESEEARLKGDPARDLGTLHHICCSHLKELQALSKEQVCVTQILRIVAFYWNFCRFAADDQKAGDGDRDAEQAQAEVHGDDPIGASSSLSMHLYIFCDSCLTAKRTKQMNSVRDFVSKLSI